MPLQDAAKPSRKQILAEERKKHGAYDPVRLAKLLPPKLTMQKRSTKVGRGIFDHGQAASLMKRDTALSTDTLDPSLSSASDTDIVDTPPAGSIPVINYGHDGSDQSAAPADNAKTQNDTSPSLVGSTTGASPASSMTSAPAAAPPGNHHMSRRMIGLITGLVVLAVILVSLACFFRRYRQRLTSSFKSPRSPKVRKWKKSQRLNSIDGLKNMSSDDRQPVTNESKTSSSDVLVTQVTPSKTPGPFDKAVINLFSPPPHAQDRTSGYLTVTPPKAGLVHQRSLDSIAEAPEPISGASTGFVLPNVKRDTTLHLSPTSPSSKRLTWGERPMTSPGKIGGFGLSGVNPFEDSGMKARVPKMSPGRPQSAKGGDIEMTKQGSKLVIRNRPSTATLRRPLSSAGSSFRSALRKTKGMSGEGWEADKDAICVETDDIVSRHGEDILYGQSKEAGSPKVSEGTYELSVPGPGRELTSQFSASTIRTPHRTSYAPTISPSGSFSFEIKDAVRQGAPVALATTASALSILGECRSAEKKGRMSAMLSTDSFVRDLDWDVRDCSFSENAQRPRTET